MRRQSGMRPQDVVVLLKIASKGSRDWFMKDLAYELMISNSEVSESLKRSDLAGLFVKLESRLNKLALLDFLESGLKYVFPVRPGRMARGLPCAHSGPLLEDIFKTEELYVWPFPEGKVRGQAIEPLYPTVPAACQKDSDFYTLISLMEALRIGKARERKMALDIIKERLNP